MQYNPISQSVIQLFIIIVQCLSWKIWQKRQVFHLSSFNVPQYTVPHLLMAQATLTKEEYYNCRWIRYSAYICTLNIRLHLHSKVKPVSFGVEKKIRIVTKEKTKINDGHKVSLFKISIHNELHRNSHLANLKTIN